MKIFFQSLSILICFSFSNSLYSLDTKLGRQNYILNCQGCHLPDASGSPGLVPAMNGFVGNFLKIQGGREFIVQVPGAANAPINDQELADVMNWLLLEFSNEQLPDNFIPYTAKEIGELRKEPLINIIDTREKLIKRIWNELGIKEEGLHGSSS